MSLNVHIRTSLMMSELLIFMFYGQNFYRKLNLFDYSKGTPWNTFGDFLPHLVALFCHFGDFLPNLVALFCHINFIVYGSIWFNFTQ